MRLRKVFSYRITLANLAAGTASSQDYVEYSEFEKALDVLLGCGISHLLHISVEVVYK